MSNLCFFYPKKYIHFSKKIKTLSEKYGLTQDAQLKIYLESIKKIKLS